MLNDELNVIGGKINESLSAKHMAREKALPLARKSIRLCANAIRAIHRAEYDKAGELIRFDTYDRPDRDPRGRTITQLFVMIWEESMGDPEAGSDAEELGWFGLHDLPQLAFDHGEIIRDVIRMMKDGAK